MARLCRRSARGRNKVLCIRPSWRGKRRRTVVWNIDRALSHRAAGHSFAGIPRGVTATFPGVLHRFVRRAIVDTCTTAFPCRRRVAGALARILIKVPILCGACGYLARRAAVRRARAVVGILRLSCRGSRRRIRTRSRGLSGSYSDCIPRSIGFHKTPVSRSGSPNSCSCRRTCFVDGQS